MSVNLNLIGLIALALFLMGGWSSSPARAADAKLHERLLKLKSNPGDDHRAIVDSTQAPWRAVGRLNSRLGGHCTATVIAPNRVLTAAHCLWNKRTRAYLPPQSLHFVAGWSKGEYLFHSKIAAIHPSKKYKPLAAKTLAVFTHDWAIVYLVDDPTPVTGQITPKDFAPGTFQARQSIGGPYAQAGYSADKRHVLTAHKNCAIRGIDKKLRIALHGCNALPGDSGSPILIQQKDGTYHLVAIHVGYAATGGTGTGLAVPAATFLSGLQLHD